MNHNPRIVVLVLTILFGVVHAELTPVPWNYIPLHSPIVSYSLEHLTDSHFFLPTLMVHDLVINIVLHLPGAVVVALFFSSTFRYAPFIFVLVNFLWTYRYVLGDPQFFASLHLVNLIPIFTVTLLPLVLILYVRRKYGVVS